MVEQTLLFTEEEKTRRKWARWALIGNLGWLHIAASFVIYVVLYSDKDTQTVRAVFDALIWAIPFSLAALISDKILEIFIKRPLPEVSRKTILTETVTPIVKVDDDKKSLE